MAASACRRRFDLGFAVGRQERRAHLDMIGERRVAALQAVPIQALKLALPLRQSRAGREQQKKRQQHRHRESHDANRLMQNFSLLRA